MSELPVGWEETTIGEIARIETGSTPPKSNTDYYGREICFFKPGDLDAGGMVSHSQDMVSKQGATVGRLLPPGTLLVTCIGNLGKTAIIAVPSICNQQINAVLPTEVAEPRYLYYWSRTIRAWLEENSSATTVSIINKGRFSAAPISVAPLLEQRRIVAKIDTLSASAVHARDHLDHIPRLIEKYKRAILAAAFRGKLTKASRPRDAEGQPSIGSLPGPWPIPSDWKWASVADVGKVSLGRQRSPKDHSGPQMRRYVRAANITWRGLSLVDVKEMNFDDREFSRFKLNIGDVLLNEGSGSAKEVGKPAIWRGEIADCCFQNTLLRVQPTACSSEFLYGYFLFCALTEQFVSSTQGVNIYHIGKDGLAKFPIPLPTKQEQDEIVRLIEKAFAWIDRLSSEVTLARKLIDRLDQAVLAKAFRGELVPQDPNDESATALLARIREERGATVNGGGKKAVNRRTRVKA
jgi:type I restriction enzyme S subunit